MRPSSSGTATRATMLAASDNVQLMKTGMDPWFEFWAKVRYALRMTRIEWRARLAYRRNV